ncbi:MAG: hypothetical protein H8K03_13025 [Nitrospira sp.]|jgi:hypothetical protein|nr:hypothetical protein [Nitrospira sp. BO4]
MSIKSILTVGLMSMMIATGVITVSDSFASDAYRVDVIDALHATVAQEDSVKAGVEWTRVDVIERIGSQGVAYPYSRPMSH